jgi:hypothetical protein
LPIHCRDIEGHEARWDRRVDEFALHRGGLGEGGIEHVDLIVEKVGRIKIGRAVHGAQGKALVDRVLGTVGYPVVIGGGCGSAAVLRPSGNSSSFAVKYE